MLQFSLRTNLQSICLLSSMCQIEGTHQAYAFTVLPSTSTVYAVVRCSHVYALQSRRFLHETWQARNQKTDGWLNQLYHKTMHRFWARNLPAKSPLHLLIARQVATHRNVSFTQPYTIFRAKGTQWCGADEQKSLLISNDLQASAHKYTPKFA